ncbi:MAG: alpha/beta hydrolase [Planctomycetes bacterium]|nr:alpha/beta hydrolase [Planctomycetota bacterium]
MIRNSFRGLLVLLFLTCLATAREVRIEKDIDYLGPDRAEKLDMYLPAEITPGAKFPGIVIIHGGGFTGGDKGAAREQNIGNTLAANGYVCVSINYLLASEGHPTWPQNVHDCKRAVRFLRKNAEKYHVDPDHIGVIGGSAGGHLTAMLGLTGSESGLDPAGPDAEISCRVQAIVPM